MERLEEVMIKLGFSTDSSMQLISQEPEEVNGKSTQAFSFVDTVCFFIFLSIVMHLFNNLLYFPFSSWQARLLVNEDGLKSGVLFVS